MKNGLLLLVLLCFSTFAFAQQTLQIRNASNCDVRMKVGWSSANCSQQGSSGTLLILAGTQDFITSPFGTRWVASKGETLNNPATVYGGGHYFAISAPDFCIPACANSNLPTTFTSTGPVISPVITCQPNLTASWLGCDVIYIQ